MTRTTVVANDRLYAVNTLEPRTRGDVFQAVLISRLIDGVTGAAVTRQRAVTTYEGLRARSASDGYVGLVGTPSRALPALSGQPYVVEVAFEAPGFATRRETVQLAAQPTFPLTFLAHDLGVLVMHRTPAQIEASAYALDAMSRPQPLAAADVTVSGWWASIDQLGNAADTGPLVSTTAALSASRPSGATLDLPAVAPLAEPDRLLLRSAGGVSRLSVSNRGGLAVGDLIAVDLGTERAELIAVVGIDAAADPGSPAELELAFPLEHTHVSGVRVRRVPAPPGTATVAVLAADALGGDRTLQVDTLAGLAAGQVVRLSGGTAAPEYRAIDFYRVTTDADGFGRLPPCTGLAAVEVTAVSGPLNAKARVTLTQPTAVRRLDLTLR
jgi:hypothetical protein